MPNYTFNLKAEDSEMLDFLAAQQEPPLSRSAMLRKLIQREARTNPAAAEAYARIYNKPATGLHKGKGKNAVQLEIEDD